ncbi:hypothetical protein AA0112_g5504 [Alternaria arborescens]|uniref:hypothetical protein n=1 Tax=Alternaria arborescens TaxID=156630 RepID=UPI001074FAA2|nr:hypothetical protein AA0111_g5291 [Alternaria arborescens]RYN33941.1 hypothetical protein AA0112_g5504 [Alternaria arborescens]RYO31017.1 hypothetical protein AA0111_g5291 [Alternaria arborescens]
MKPVGRSAGLKSRTLQRIRRSGPPPINWQPTVNQSPPPPGSINQPPPEIGNQPPEQLSAQQEQYPLTQVPYRRPDQQQPVYPYFLGELQLHNTEQPHTLHIPKLPSALQGSDEHGYRLKRSTFTRTTLFVCGVVGVILLAASFSLWSASPQISVHSNMLDGAANSLTSAMFNTLPDHIRQLLIKAETDVSDAAHLTSQAAKGPLSSIAKFLNHDPGNMRCSTLPNWSATLKVASEAVGNVVQKVQSARAYCGDAVKAQQYISATINMDHDELVRNRKWAHFWRLPFSRSIDRTMVKGKYGDYQATMTSVSESQDHTVKAEKLLGLEENRWKAALDGLEELSAKVSKADIKASTSGECPDADSFAAFQSELSLSLHRLT